MLDENEIRNFRNHLEKLTGFITDYGSDEEFNDNTLEYANNLCDALSWALGEITTEDFQSDAYLNLPRLEAIAKNVEERSGKNLLEYYLSL